MFRSHVLVCGSDHLLQFRGIHGDRFFADYIFACRESCNDDLLMDIIRGCHGDKVNLRIGQEFLACGIRMDSFAFRKLTAFRVDIIDADQFDSIHGLHFLGMEIAHSSVADDGSADCFAVHFFLQPQLFFKGDSISGNNIVGERELSSAKGRKVFKFRFRSIGRKKPVGARGVPLRVFFRSRIAFRRFDYTLKRQ